MAPKKNTQETEAAQEVKVPETVDMAEIKRQIDEMIEAAKAEAKKIIDEAKAETAPEKDTKAEAKAASIARGEELVEIKLFRDNGKYKEDVYVGCNGENCVIQRGVRVKIKRKFAEILDNSEIQDYETSELIAAEERKLLEAEARHGII